MINTDLERDDVDPWFDDELCPPSMSSIRRHHGPICHHEQCHRAFENYQANEADAAYDRGRLK